MPLESALAYVAAAAALALALVALWREGRSVAHRAFALGMTAFAAREILAAQTVETLYYSDLLRWHQWRLLAEATFPSIWIFFSLTFARANYASFLKRWRWALLAAFAVPIGIVSFGWSSLLNPSTPVPFLRWLIPIGTAGYVLHVVLLLSYVVVLMNLEKTLRASGGGSRWQIKFFVLGLAALFGVELFLDSQVLLYSAIRTTLFPFGSAAILLAGLFVVVSFFRSRLDTLGVYPSETFLYNSLTLLIVGVYLLVVAGIVEAIDALGGAFRAPLVAFVVLLAIVGLMLLLLSTELRQRAKAFLNRHLERPSYDYRQIWDTFTRRTSDIVEITPLCAAITKMAAETFGCAAATIWLAKDREHKVLLGGSTSTSEEKAASILREYEDGAAFFEVIAQQPDKPIDTREATLSVEARELLREAEARYVVALLDTTDTPIGLLTLNDRVTRQDFTIEDFSLLRTFADQAAAALLNRRLAAEVQRAREMEQFQALSAFFIHDLKNLASRLSLAMQNLPAHYDKPEFRKDLLNTMTKSLAKIEAMTARLSSVTKGLELRSRECDLNALVEATLSGINGTVNRRLERELRDVPPVKLDPEQIQKVLTNLILNAQEATKDDGHITVRTGTENRWALLAVRDDGCGMSSEFVANSLFKPFQTTKKQGLGIGLFHSKKIVEAHGGRIEVASAKGEGTTFRIFLPSTA